MAISRSRKEDLVAQYVDLLEASNGISIVRTQGMSVPRVQTLRKVILDAGGQYVVAKNTLITKAMEQKGWIVPEELLAGPTGIVFGKDNFPGVVKAILGHIKDVDLPEEQFSLSGGVLGGSDIFGADRVEAISNMPTLPELQAQILGLLVQPAQNLVSVLHAANGGIVNVLQAADTQVLNVLQAWLQKREQEGAA
ncbi:50S ribosomal protein L10 [Phototrophicus methaneseepsis]|uniref:Large ribosomal subunit protein uL10 n=1 Tax=Phototrophicus methaneseepsis TaxID=2710758 RepID=A0A7S8E8G2_9CHLR|nr:50S ribosomal protein L10 [Phototrophicus methaneseepsis]QPC82314.1 50S ribosomal protein L10 [Phototrophicus methaneseepsis]